MPDPDAPLGILMLDTRFPRPVGDGGNPLSYPFPAVVRRVEGASVARAVRGDPVVLLDAFIRGGEALVAQGCAAIVTTCGFLVPLQEALSRALPVPIGTSALTECVRVEVGLPPGQRVGVLSIAASALTPAHYRAARLAPDTPVGSLEGGAFARAILGNGTGLDMEAARREHVAGARDLVARHPEVGAIVLECANMPPHAEAISQATGRPVHSILTLAARLREEALVGGESVGVL